MSEIRNCPFCKKGIMIPIDLELKYWTDSRYGSVRKSIEAFECDHCEWIAFKTKEK